MNSIQHITTDIVEEFELFDDWMEKYDHLIDMGKSLPLIRPEWKTEDRLVKGCQSRVWLAAEWKDGRVVFSADSDAIITKGIIALLIRVFSNRTPVEIIQADVNFIDEIGLREHLSSTRSNGLVSMIGQMKQYAQAFEKMYGV